VFDYGIGACLAGLGALLFWIGFMGNLPFLPKTIDAGSPGTLAESIPINLALIALFGIQHAVMARPVFKKAITHFIPVAAERSTFVLLV